MELNIKLLDNSQVSVSLPPESSVRDLKGRLKERLEVSEDRQRLIYRGRVLQDAQTLMQSGLETGTTLHCVVRPENLPAPTAAPEGAAQTGMQTEMGGRRIMFGGNTSLRESGILSDILRLTNPAGQPGRSGRAPDAAPINPDSLEHIRQGLLTMHTMLSGMGSAAGDEGGASPATAVQGGGASSSGSAGVESHLELSQSACARRRFFVGQWLDVKDTVSQWLEATVMEIRGDTLKVHYNGWPTRWDEWLPFTSQRIAPFRTRTLHTSHAAYMSPYPVSHVRDAPVTGQDDIRAMLPEVLNMVRTVGSYLETLSGMCEEDLMQQVPTEQEEEQERPWLQQLPWEAERAREEERRRRRVGQEHILPEEEIHQVAALSSGGGSPGSLSSGSHFRGRRKRSLHELAADVAPLLDRCGRVLADLAPHVSSLAAARGQPAPRVVQPEAAAADTSTAASTSTSRPRTGRPAARDRNGPRSRTPSPDTAFRQLIAMPARPPNGFGMPGLGPNVDIHIHAFVTPLRTNAAATGTAAGATPGTQEAPVNAGSGPTAGTSARAAEGAAAEDPLLQALGLAPPTQATPSSAAPTTTNPSNTVFSSSSSSTNASSSSNTQAGVTPNAYYGLMSSSLLASPTSGNANPGPSTTFSSTQSGETPSTGVASSGPMEQRQEAAGHGDTDTAGAAGGLTQFFSLLRRFSS